MTDHTDEELIALAKKGGAEVLPISGTQCDSKTITFTDMSILAFTGLLRQQDMARLARMREALEKARNGIIWYSENSDDADDSDTEMLCEIDAALSETSDVQEWVDGQRADERELCAKICDEREHHLLSLAKIQTTDEDRNSYLSDCFIVRSLSEAIRARRTKGEG